MEPLKLSVRGSAPLTERLKQINYEGACVIAAHQERIRNGKPGYVDNRGIADPAKRDLFIQEGNKLIQNVIQ
jgi:hypothetical protein